MTDKYNIHDENGRYVGSAEKDPTPSLFSPTGGESYNVYNSTGGRVGRVESTSALNIPTKGWGAVVVVGGGFLLMVFGTGVIPVFIVLVSMVFGLLFWGGVYWLLGKFGMSTKIRRWGIGTLILGSIIFNLVHNA